MQFRLPVSRNDGSAETHNVSVREAGYRSLFAGQALLLAYLVSNRVKDRVVDRVHGSVGTDERWSVSLADSSRELDHLR